MVCHYEISNLIQDLDVYRTKTGTVTTGMVKAITTDLQNGEIETLELASFKKAP